MARAGVHGLRSRADPVGISEIAEQFLEAVDIPLFLFDTDATVLWLNPRARKFLERSKMYVGPEGLVRSDTIPNWKIKAVRSRLRDALRAAPDWDGGTSKVVQSSLTNAKFHMNKLGPDDDRAIACVVIEHPSQKPDNLLSQFSKYGLTETEKRIASRLMEGETASEIAANIGIALLTVRTHIKRIYSKLGVNCRGKMFAQLTMR